MNKNKFVPQQIDIQACDIIPAKFQNGQPRMIVIRMVTEGGVYDVPMLRSWALTLANAIAETAR